MRKTYGPGYPRTLGALMTWSDELFRRIWDSYRNIRFRRWACGFATICGTCSDSQRTIVAEGGDAVDPEPTDAAAVHARRREREWAPHHGPLRNTGRSFT